jgi:NAD(P)H-hydrate epimerase
MKILSAQQTREADAYTIAHEPISSIDLMERASKKCLEWLIKKFEKKSFVVFCGIGNNGGDGLAISRMLHENGKKTRVFIVDFSNKHSEDFDINYKRLIDSGVDVSHLGPDEMEFQLNKDEIIVDAIFGSGLDRPIDGFVKEVVVQINLSGQPVVAIDIPSGLFSDSKLQAEKASAVSASYTLTFQQPKLTMMFPENFQFVGQFEVLDIGLNQEYLKAVETNHYYVKEGLVSAIVTKRDKFAHKGTFGHALLVAGSEGKMGAAIMAGKACLRSGVGLLTAQVPKKGYEIMQVAVPEAMCVVDDSASIISKVINVNPYNAIGIGPGIGTNVETHKVLKILIQNAKAPMVLDADALNILSENKTWISFVPSKSILTPHPKEFSRLVGTWANDEERLKMQVATSQKNDVIIVLKGANTSITLPNGEVYFNSTGNAGMATGGSGDVLTGLITGLLAQNYTPEKAAILGVYLHGLAGDLGKTKLGENSLIASDIIDNISEAFKLVIE